MPRPCLNWLLTAVLVIGASCPGASAASRQDVDAWRESRDVESLLLAVADPDATVAAAAQQALDELGEPLGRLILESIRGSAEARAALAQRKDRRATVPLLQALADGPPVHRMHVVRALGELGDEAAVPVLIDFARNYVSLSRTADHAAPYWALFKLGDPRALDVFLTGLESADHSVREAAAWGMSAVMQPRAIDAALKALRDDNPSVRAAAATAFRRIPTPAAVAPLRRLLADPSRMVRQAAAYALGATGNPAEAGALRPLLEDADPDVRAAAAWAVGTVGDQSAVDSLLELLGDPDAAVRDSAAESLERLGWPLGMQLLAALGGDRAALAELSAANDPRVVPPLARLATGTDPVASRAALSVLAGLGQPGAEAALVAAASGWGAGLRVRAACALLRSPDLSGAAKARQFLRLAFQPVSLVYLVLLTVATTGLVLALRRFRRKPARGDRPVGPSG